MMVSKILKKINKVTILKIVFIIILCVSTAGYFVYHNTTNHIQNKTSKLKSENVIKSREKIEKRSNTKSVVYLFYLPTCGYCHRAMSFIETNLKDKYKNIDFRYINVGLKDGRQLYFKIKNELGIVSNGVPVMVIGKRYFLGFGDSTGDEYIKTIETDILNKKNK